MSKLKEKVMSGLFWSITQAWSDQAISLVVFIILARLLAPEAFGVVAIASILIGMLTLFVQQGIAPSIIQRKDLESGHLNAAFWMNLASGFLFASVAWILAGPVSRFYEFPELVWVIRLLSINLIIISMTEVQRALLSKYFKFRTLALRSIVATIAGGIAGIVLASRGFGVYSLVGQQVINSIISLVVLWSTTTWTPGVKMDKRHFHDLWGFGLKILGSGLLNKVRKKSDVLILSVLFGPVVVGYYTVAMKPVTMIVTLFSKVVSRVALPAFSALQAEPERLSRALSKALSIIAIFLFPVIATVLIMGDSIILILFGEAWAQSGTMLRMLALWALAQSVLILVVQCILAKGRPGVVMTATAVLAVASPLGMIAASPLGVYGVIAANVVINCLIGAAFLVIVRKITGFSWATFWLDLRGPALGVVGLAVVFVAVGQALTGHAEIVVSLILGGLAYTAILLAMEERSPAKILRNLKGYLTKKGRREKKETEEGGGEVEVAAR